MFGTQDCMGRVRTFSYDVVVGIGGIGAEPRSHSIDRRLNWIGIGPILGPDHANRGHPTFTFRHFVLHEHSGAYFDTHCPRLAEAMCDSGCRFRLNHTAEHIRELKRLVAWAKRKAGPSGLYVASELLGEATHDDCLRPDCTPMACPRSHAARAMGFAENCYDCGAILDQREQAPPLQGSHTAKTVWPTGSTACLWWLWLSPWHRARPAVILVFRPRFKHGYSRRPELSFS